MSRLFIVRHGNTFLPGEAARRIGARTDLPLTAEGEEQARRLGLLFRDTGVVFGRAMTGPLRRARATARLVLAAMDDAPSPAVEAALDEIDHGADENLPEDEVVARHGAALDRWETHASPPAGWLIDGAARLEWWRSLLETPPAGDTLIVTSNGAARFALLVLDDARRPARMKLRTGAFGMLRHDRADGWQVDRWDERPAPPTAP